MESVKYARMPDIPVANRKWPDASIQCAPRWCAVDLRDGNQALPNPMTPEQKLEYFNLLVDIGFKEIEVGFPSASADDYNFCRNLIKGNLIPDDVTISVLTQAREHLINKTLEVLEGASNAVIHFYIATSELHSKFVFGLSDDEIIDSSVASTRRIRDGINSMGGSNIGLEFSPEEFTDSSLDFTIKLCNAVVSEWNPRGDEKVILNLPQTVERRLPNQYADMIEEFINRQKYSDKTVVSVHNHNDMGCAVAATMQTLLAGATRVEGTLFGHGERTGNVDLTTVGLNLEYLGIDTGLDFSKLNKIAKTVEDITEIAIQPRHPYAGELVFTAFSGSHQDAIHKGLSKKDELIRHFGGWKVPYLHVDPGTVGRVYEQFIRINSQSGKGGVAHVMETEYRIKMPRWVQIDFAKHVQKYADKTSKELSSHEVFSIFKEIYMNCEDPVSLINYWPRPADDDPKVIKGELHVNYQGDKRILKSEGNGPISAFVHALREIKDLPEFILEDYAEETMGVSAEAEAVCFVRVQIKNSNTEHIGVGLGNNIDQAAVASVLAGLNALINQSK